MSHHYTQCHIIIHRVTSSYIVSHHHTSCHIINGPRHTASLMIFIMHTKCIWLCLRVSGRVGSGKRVALGVYFNHARTHTQNTPTPVPAHTHEPAYTHTVRQRLENLLGKSIDQISGLSSQMTRIEALIERQPWCLNTVGEA